MSADTLVSVMDKMLKLHKSLYELAVKKTHIVKTGDTATLNLLMKDEQAHVAAINKLEQERQAVTKKILPDVEQPSLLEIAEASAGEKEQLLNIKNEMVNLISEIKTRNELNQQLIHQSLQFINFSKSIVMPQEKDYNYGPPAGSKKQAGQSPGMFNSKA